MGLVIYGSGGHGRDMATDIMDLIYFRDDKYKGAWEQFVQKWPKVDRLEYLCGVNDPWIRASIVQNHPELSWKDGGRWIHRAAMIGPGCEIGEHSHINAGAFLTRTVIGQFCTISPNATICGDVNIGDFVQIGANATILNLLTIGEGAIIGAGAVVTTSVPPGVTVVGNPARPIRKAAA